MRLSTKTAAAAALTFAALAPAAHGAEIGQTATTDRQWFGCSSTVQERSGPVGPSYTVPFDGELTRWRYQAATDVQPLRLQVFRPVSTTFPRSWRVVGESRLETPVPNTLNVFTTSIPVRAGDRLGLAAQEVPGGHVFNCFFLTRDSGDEVRTFPTMYSVGELAVEEGPGVTAHAVNVSATVEDVCRNKKGKQKKPKWCSKR